MHTPESALAAGIILQAHEDLYSDDDRIRDEARTFFVGGGEWRKSRDAWFAMAGVDPDAVIERLGALVDENPSVEFLCKGLTRDGTFDSLPDGTFMASELDGNDPALSVKKLRLLTKAGFINQVRRGYFEKAAEYRHAA